MSIRGHLTGLPTDLADALDHTYRDVIDHYLRGEPDDAQVDAGRFCEAALRYLEFKMTGKYTMIDGKSKPNRKKVVNDALQDTSLEPTLRAQVPQGVELVMDFRNNRNSAHLGKIDANDLDASCVVQNVTWVIGEIARIESNDSPAAIQALLDSLAQRHVPLVQVINGRPIILDPAMRAEQRVLIVLYQSEGPVPMGTLREWADYRNSTRFRVKIVGGLEKQKRVHVDKDGSVQLLRPGEVEAQRILLEAGSRVA